MSSPLVFAQSDQPRVSVSRSIFALVNDVDRAYFGGPHQGRDQFGYIVPDRLAVPVGLMPRSPTCWLSN